MLGTFEDPVRMVFNTHLWEKLNTECATFCTAFAEAAVQSCGCKVTGPCHSSNPETWWWTIEVMGAIKLKRIVQSIVSYSGTPEAASSYWLVK